LPVPPLPLATDIIIYVYSFYVYSLTILVPHWGQLSW